MIQKATQEFKRFVETEALPAIADLQNLSDKQRIHVQKLVYTNLVDRFDTMIDQTILDNCRHAKLVDEALSGLSGAITEADLVRLLMQSETLQDALDVNSH